MNEKKAAPVSKSRRMLLKAGAGMAALGPAKMLSGLAPQSTDASKPVGCTEPPYISPHGPTGRVAKAGYKNDANRPFGNGPMDRTTEQIVDYVFSFSDAELTSSILDSLSDVLIDSLGCIIAGADSDPVRIAARIARANPAGPLKSTVLGYGITTTPEMAAFAVSCMLRHNDFNDNGLHGGHFSDIVPGILAVGEAFHSSGKEILAAIALGYEVLGGLEMATMGTSDRGFDSLLYVGPAAALAAGKLAGLNRDQLANALALSFVPHIPINPTHSAGPLSMWKGCHSGEAVRCAIFGVFLAKEGMTAPCAPFEGKKGLWDAVSGPFKNFRLPTPDDATDWYRKPGQRVVEGIGFKRFMSDGNSQTTMEVVPEFGKFAKPEEVASIHIQMRNFGEIGDMAKWDPKNEETADHSLPYLFCRSFLDGEVYLDSFTPKKLADPGVRRLMDLVTIEENPDLKAGPRITLRTKDGRELTREVPLRFTRMTREEVQKKFTRICDFCSVSKEQQSHIVSTWTNLLAAKDIAVPIRDLARFGRRLSL